MRFQRGRDIKETAEIGLSKKALKIGWVKFEIGVYNPERYKGLPGKVHNPLFNIKLNLKGDYIESARELLKSLNESSTSLEDLMKYVEKLPGRDRRTLNEYKRIRKRLFLLVEAGSSDWGNDRIGFNKLEYLKFHGEIYPVSKGPHFLTYKKYESWLERISAKIPGFLRKKGDGDKN